MAITFKCDTTEAIDLPTFIEKVDRYLDPEDLESLADCAPHLKSLANNRRFLTEELNRDLESWRGFQAGNRYTAQTMTLGRGKHFFVRANIWTPLSNRPGVRDAEERLFFHHVPHDHNFSFLTAGYFGSGYETVIFEYDCDTVSGEIGESAGVRFLEKTSLSQGKVMLYRAGRDIHSQEPASEFSVSLNLMLISPERKQQSQFFFNLENGTISGVAANASSNRTLICRLARHLGDARSIGLLSALAASHDSEKIRAAAYEALAERHHFSCASVWELALSDKHPFVRAMARKALTTNG